MLRLLGVLFLAAISLTVYAASPRLASVTPEAGKAAGEFTATGENLSKAEVAELYLTDGKNDIKLVVIEQANESIKFKVPESVKAGRYALMILTADRKQFLEQPVKVTIE